MRAAQMERLMRKFRAYTAMDAPPPLCVVSGASAVESNDRTNPRERAFRSLLRGQNLLLAAESVLTFSLTHVLHSTARTKPPQPLDLLSHLQRRAERESLTDSWRKKRRR